MRFLDGEGALDLLDRLLQRHPSEVRMRPGVRADCVPLRLNLARHIGILLHHLADVEEGRLRALRGERGKDLLCIRVMRAIVEREYHLSLLQQRRLRILNSKECAARRVHLRDALNSELAASSPQADLQRGRLRTASVLQAIQRYCPRSVIAKGLKPAAVLVPIHERAGEHYLTLIERAATLRSHSGEIAFPGGNVTAEDKDTLATALREFQEEIGIDPENVQIIGQLDQVTVGSRYLVTPFVGIVMSPFNASPNKEEVSSVISIPVSALLDPDCFTTELKTDGKPRVIYHFRYEALDIWGATARILKQLLEVAYGFRANGKLA